MSSKSFTPYVYIIQHNISKKYYIGVQYNQNASPSDLFTKYFTSSRRIHDMLDAGGIFCIKRIRTFKTSSDAFAYETKLLQRVKAATNPKIINLHENTNGFNNEAFKKIIHEKYGVANISQLDWVKTKVKRTMSLKTPEELKSYIDKTKRTCFETYGTYSHMQSEEYMQKRRDDMLKKHGVEYVQSLPWVRDKISKALKGRVFTEEHCNRLKAANKGLVAAIDLRTNTKCRVQKDVFDANPTIYVGSTTGFLVVKDYEGNHYYVPKTDSRYVSGELVHISKGVPNTKIIGTAPAKTLDGVSIGRVPLTDIRWKTGEIISQNKGIETKFKGSKWMMHPTLPSRLVVQVDFQKHLDNGFSFGRGDNGKAANSKFKK